MHGGNTYERNKLLAPLRLTYRSVDVVDPDGGILTSACWGKVWVERMVAVRGGPVSPCDGWSRTTSWMRPSSSRSRSIEGSPTPLALRDRPSAGARGRVSNRTRARESDCRSSDTLVPSRASPHLSSRGAALLVSIAGRPRRTTPRFAVELAARRSRHALIRRSPHSAIPDGCTRRGS
jgi:hypothetical protein